jgi:malate dehydrogenase
MTSLSIVGVGRIGGQIAFLASYLGLADELVLVEKEGALLDAQVKDLLHGMPDLDISTEPEEIRTTDLCVFTAGIPRNPSVKSRADLLSANLQVARSCAPFLEGFGGILFTVVNPVDAINYYLFRAADLDSHRCIGFGGQLDSARFSLELNARGLEGPRWVLGEHGEHQVPIFSRLYSKVPTEEREEILAQLRGASMEVIRGKGGTLFGPAAHLINLMEMVIDDANVLVPVSCILQGEYEIEGCSLGVPAEVGWGGILSIEEWNLDTWEQEHFMNAAHSVQKLIEPLFAQSESSR